MATFTGSHRPIAHQPFCFSLTQPATTILNADRLEVMTPGTEAALESKLKFCDQDRRSIDVVQTADMTGDGVPEALWAHTLLAMIQLMGGKPVLAHF